jgi:hypothetical protein
MAHTYNSSNSVSRDEEHHGLKPPQATNSQDPISKIPNTKRTGGNAEVVESKL